MRDDGSITEQEEATLAEAIEIMGRWLDAHRDEIPFQIPGFWGIEEARHQLEQNLGYMTGK